MSAGLDADRNVISRPSRQPPPPRQCRDAAGSLGAALMIAGAVLVAWKIPVRLIADEGTANETKSAGSPNSAAQPSWLSDLPEQDVHVGYGQFGKKGQAGFLNVPISLNGVASPHGLGMHPPKATVSYQLDKKYRMFRATVAINDSSPNGPQSPIFFQVEADGKPIWESRGFQGPRKWQPVLLDIAGVQRLTLKVDVLPQKGTDSAWAHAVWLDPFVSEAAPDAQLLKLQAQEHYKEFDEASDYRQHVRKLFKEDKFAELEQVAKEARAKRDCLGGSPRLWWFYSALYQPFADTEASRLEQIDRAGDWQKAFPDSVIPRVVAADNWLEFGFAARGTGSSGTVTEEGWKLLAERLAKAREILDAAEPLEPKDPEFYSRLISLAQCQELSREQVDPLLEKAIALDPTYYPAYRTMASYLLPRWHGQEGDERKLAESLRDRIGGTNGQIAYAMVAMQHANYDGVGVLAYQYPYKDLKTALQVECQVFPALVDDIERAAWLAGVSDDPATAREMFERLPPQAWHSSVWGTCETMEHCRRWSAADPRNAEEIRTLHGNGTVPLRLAMSADGKSLATGGYYGEICFWDVAKGSITDVAHVPGPVHLLTFDPKAPRLLVSSGDPRSQGSLLFYDFEGGGGQRITPLKGHSKIVYDATLTSDGKRLASASSDKTARIWPVDDPQQTISIPHPNEVCSVSFSPDGSQICTATDHGGIYLWDAKTGKPIGAPLAEEGKLEIFPWVRFLPDGERIIMVYQAQAGPLQLWDLKTRKPTSAATGDSVIWCAALSPDGRWLALGRENGAVEMFDVASLKKLHSFEGHWARVTGLVFMADGQSLISASHDMTLKVWDARPWTSMANSGRE